MCCSDGQTSKWPCWNSSWLNIAEVEISLRERRGGRRKERRRGRGRGEERGAGERAERAERGGDVIVLRFAVIAIPVRKSCCSNCTDTD